MDTYLDALFGPDRTFGFDAHAYPNADPDRISTHTHSRWILMGRRLRLQCSKSVLRQRVMADADSPSIRDAGLCNPDSDAE
jgi:hypothetical protein